MKNIKMIGTTFAAGAALAGALALAGPAAAAPSAGAQHSPAHVTAPAPRQPQRAEPASPTQGRAALTHREEQRARQDAALEHRQQAPTGQGSDPGFTPPEPPVIPVP